MNGPQPLHSNPERKGFGERIAEWLPVAWFTLLFVLGMGVTNGDTPQNSYLLLGLRLADPGFLPGDWFTWHTVHSHPLYGGIVALLAHLGPLSFGLTLGMVLQNAALPLALYTIVARLYDRPLLPWAAMLAVFAALHATSLGSEPWVKSFLGVSSLAGVAMVIAIAQLMGRKPVSGGIWLGIAALVHAHFLALSLPVLVAATAALRWRGNHEVSWTRLSGMWAGFLVVSIPTIVQMFRFATAPGAEEIHWLTATLFPYHLAPRTWDREPFVILAGAILLGTGGMLLRPPRHDRVILFTMLLVGASVFVSLALAYAELLDLAAQAWPWRLSPLLLIAGLTAGLAAITGSGGRESGPGSRRDIGFGFLLGGAVLMAAVSAPPVSYVLLALAFLPAVTGLVRLSHERWRVRAVRPGLAGALLVTLAFAPVVARAVRISHVEFRAERAERAVLYDWVRAHTPEDAVFAIPPTWEKFRTIARRPIVVDWKAISRYPPDRIEWVERMRAITGVERPSADGGALDAGYARMDCSVAERIHAEYGVRYVVQERPKELPCGRLVYEDEHFRVWDLQDQADAPD